MRAQDRSQDPQRVPHWRRAKILGGCRSSEGGELAHMEEILVGLPMWPLGWLVSSSAVVTDPQMEQHTSHRDADMLAAVPVLEDDSDAEDWTDTEEDWTDAGGEAVAMQIG